MELQPRVQTHRRDVVRFDAEAKRANAFLVGTIYQGARQLFANALPAPGRADADGQLRHACVYKPEPGIVLIEVAPPRGTDGLSEEELVGLVSRAAA